MFQILLRIKGKKTIPVHDVSEWHFKYISEIEKSKTLFFIFYFFYFNLMVPNLLLLL